MSHLPTSIMFAVAAGLFAAPLLAAKPSFPVIQGYGGIQPTAGAAERPDKHRRYRVVFNVTKEAAAPGTVNPSLDKMARFINLLGADGVKAARGDLIAIVHGPATPLVMHNAAYRAKFGVDNPNLELIALLRQSGAQIHVCSQALAGNKIARENVVSGVQVDVSALTTLANLQLQGFALIPD